MTIEQVIQELKIRNIEYIKEEARNGNEKAQCVLRFGGLLATSQGDPAAQGFLISAYEDWKKEREKNVNEN